MWRSTCYSILKSCRGIVVGCRSRTCASDESQSVSIGVTILTCFSVLKKFCRGAHVVDCGCQTRLYNPRSRDIAVCSVFVVTILTCHCVWKRSCRGVYHRRVWMRKVCDSLSPRVSIQAPAPAGEQDPLPTEKRHGGRVR